MRIQIGKRFLFASTLIVLMLILLLVNDSRKNALYPSNLGNYNQTGAVIIEPETILLSLERGESDIFIPIQKTSDFNKSPLPPGSILWTQTDYLKIAAAFHEFVWKESIVDWGIYYLAFDRECRDNSMGFDSAEITLFKSSGLEYHLRRIEINPLTGKIMWGAETSYPRPMLGEWDNIDLSKFGISADQALQIAEEYGGRENRKKDNNECKVLIRIPNTIDDRRWDVSYYSSPNFEILIDPYSGDHEILVSSP